MLGTAHKIAYNEGNEPMHIHCQSAEKECKFWLMREIYDVEIAYSCKYVFTK
ncbi:MAG: DUF4160 domain-containing protein [Spirochaetia bacterium]|nr:DUF4160 domain-containing protein [Spirochaetia bacterium]